MRTIIVVLFALLWSTPARAQSTDALRADLEALHAKWFKAFDTGDGAAMEQMERSDLVLVMPNGTIHRKTTPRRPARFPRAKPDTNPNLE